MIESKFTLVGTIQLVDRQHGGGGPTQPKRLAQARNLGIDAPDTDIEEGVQSMLTGLRNPGDPESVEIVSTDLHNERYRGQSRWHDLAGQSSACRSWLHSAQESTVARPFGACQRVEDHSNSSPDLQHHG